MPTGVKSSSTPKYSRGSALVRKKCWEKLPPHLKAQFSAYFLNRYPDTKRIKLSMDAQFHYTARAKYGERRTFIVKAYSYETLVIRMHAAYESRGFQPKNNR